MFDPSLFRASAIQHYLVCELDGVPVPLRITPPWTWWPFWVLPSLVLLALILSIVLKVEVQRTGCGVPHIPGTRTLTRLGGRPVREHRDQVVYMLQGFQLYGISILGNLRILSGQAPLERLLSAAESSGLSRFVATLPRGYETLLSQGGSNVSGGQRQLVLLTAGTMATERRILLLDEAFANLGWSSRSEILHGDWFQGKTIIYASHDAGLPKE